MCNIIDLIFWFFGLGRPQARQLAIRLLMWISFIMDCDGWYDTLDEDPFSVPLLQANKQCRNIPKRLKEAVVKAAGKGDGFRSNAHVMKVMKKLKFRMINGIGDPNRWSEPVMREYYFETQSVMTSCTHPVYCISIDATRLSEKDMLFGSVYSASSQVADWCTPIVSRGHYAAHIPTQF